MASTVSTYLSKSKTDFKPKAPLRRPVPASSQAFVRGSVDRQLQAQSSLRSDRASTDDTLTIATNEQTPSSASTAQVRSFNITEINADSTPQLDTSKDGAFPTSAAHLTFPQQAIPLTSNTEDNHAVSSSTQRPRSLKSNTLLVQTPSTGLEISSSALSDAISSTNPNEHRQSEDENQEEDARPSKRRKVTSTQVLSKDNFQRRRSDGEAGDDTEQAVPTSSNDRGTLRQRNLSSKSQQQRSRIKNVGITRADSIVDIYEASFSAKESARKVPRNKRTTMRQGKTRPVTPEEGERCLEPDSVRMSDLCMDNGRGKKSGRETRLEERDAEERQAKERSLNDEASQVGQAVHGQVLNSQGLNGRPSAANTIPAAPTTDEPTGAARLVPTLQLVNGQLVLDEASRIIDRHADAEATRQPQEEHLEDDLSRKINGATFMKRTSSTRWTEECNSKFFDGLRMFGTDFGMISKLFPGRTRRHIKLKYDREERSDPERIQEALEETIPVDMESFSRISQTEYKDPSELEQAMAEDRKMLEEEQAREQEAMEELTRQRAAEAAAESAAVGGESAPKENDAGIDTTTEAGAKAVRRGRKSGPGAGRKASKASMVSGRRSRQSDGGIVLGPR